MRHPKKITEKVAGAFIENPENFDLSEANSISDEAALTLVDYAAEHPSLDEYGCLKSICRLSHSGVLA